MSAAAIQVRTLAHRTQPFLQKAWSLPNGMFTFFLRLNAEGRIVITNCLKKIASQQRRIHLATSTLRKGDAQRACGESLHQLGKIERSVAHLLLDMALKHALRERGKGVPAFSVQ